MLRVISGATMAGLMLAACDSEPLTPYAGKRLDWIAYTMMPGTEPAYITYSYPLGPGAEKRGYVMFDCRPPSRRDIQVVVMLTADTSAKEFSLTSGSVTRSFSPLIPASDVPGDVSTIRPMSTRDPLIETLRATGKLRSENPGFTAEANAGELAEINRFFDFCERGPY